MLVRAIPTRMAIARMKLVILCNHKLHSRTLHLLVTVLDAKHDAQN